MCYRLWFSKNAHLIGNIVLTCSLILLVSDADHVIMVRDYPVYESGRVVLPTVSKDHNKLLIYDLRQAYYGFYLYFNVSLYPSEKRMPAFAYSKGKYRAIGKS